LAILAPGVFVCFLGLRFLVGLLHTVVVYERGLRNWPYFVAWSDIESIEATSYAGISSVRLRPSWLFVPNEVLRAPEFQRLVVAYAKPECPLIAACKSAA
jgi:hypothetical protein